MVKVIDEYNCIPHSVTTFSLKFLFLGIEPFERLVGLKIYLKEARETAFKKSLD